MKFLQFVAIFFIVFFTSNHSWAKTFPSIDDQLVNYRLPNNSLPLHYFLRIETDIHNGTEKFNGVVRIRIKITDPTNAITLHAKNESILIKSIDLFDDQGLIRKYGLAYKFENERDFLQITLDATYALNVELILAITYQGTLNDGIPEGFYKTFYVDEEFNQIYLLSTYLRPTYARMAFPCYDEPQIRATFQLDIQHDKNYKAISNTKAVNRTDQENYAITRFETTPAMQCYLLSFVVSRLESIENGDSKFLQSIYGDPQKIVSGEGEIAMEIVSEVYEKIVEIFNFPTPLKKVDHIAVPSMNRAPMESFGVITYDEFTLLMNKNFDQNVLESRRRDATKSIAHEFSRQLMAQTAIEWWQYLWLSEGFAKFYQFYIPSLLYPNFDFMEQFRNEFQDKFFHIDDGNETLNEYFDAPMDIQMRFNSIFIEKAAVLIRMFHEALTPSTFTKGLKIFLNDTRLLAATPNDLHRALQQAYDEDNEEEINVGKMMASWENQPGFPLLSVSRNEDGDIVVRQKRYIHGKVSNMALPLYSIPLTFATSSKPSFDSMKAQLWMTDESTIIPNVGTNEWIIFNIQQVGYYKVEYSRDLWAPLIAGYKKNPEIIHKINREVLHAEMLDAWLNLGTQSISDCLKLLEVLDVEVEGSVWQTAGDNIEKLNEFLRFSELYVDFLDLMHGLLSPHVDGNDLELRREIERWSKETQLESFLEVEHEKLLSYMETNDPMIKLDFCSAFRIANSTIYQHFFDKVFIDNFFLNSELIWGLGCSKDGEKLRKHLENLLNPEIRIFGPVLSEAFYLTMRSSESGLEAVMDVTSNHTNDIQRITFMPIENTLTLVAKLINTPRHFEQYKTLANKLVNDAIITQETFTELETEIESKLKSPDWDEIRNWFETRNEETTTTSSSTSLRYTATFALSTSIKLVAICAVTTMIKSLNFMHI